MIGAACTPGLTLVNADMRGQESLRVVGSRIAALGEAPCSSDSVVDLQGDRVLPGLINAHDHLHLNSLPPLNGTHHLRNVREWIAQINLRRQNDPQFEASIAVPRDTRLLIGGVKNLLSGVTTVAHHDPLYPFLTTARFPIQVVKDYGWSHSLYTEGDEQVRNSYRATPRELPWIIHAAEGLDEEAAGEFARLDALGCVGANTLIVHGVAMDREERARLERVGAGLIWCPSSNLNLFGETADIADLVGSGHVALGTDSRLSGSRDLLCELGTARTFGGLDEVTLESLVTRSPATLLRIPDRGSLSVGARADVLVLPRGMALSRATRADVRLVMLGGVALYAEPEYARLFVAVNGWTAVRVDGRPKMLDSSLAAALFDGGLGEQGLEISHSVWRAA